MRQADPLRLGLADAVPDAALVAVNTEAIRREQWAVRLTGDLWLPLPFRLSHPLPGSVFLLFLLFRIIRPSMWDVYSSIRVGTEFDASGGFDASGTGSVWWSTFT